MIDVEEEADAALVWMDRHRDELAEALNATLKKIDPNIIGAACVFGIKLDEGGGQMKFVVQGLGCGEWSTATAIQALDGFLPLLKAKHKAEQN